MLAAASGRRAARVSVTAYFVLYGVILAIWVTRIPAIKQGLGLTNGQLGLALLALPAGVLLITLVAGRLVDRVGSARVTAAGGAVMALLLIPPALAGGLGSLSAALFAFGIGAGALNVGMNANGVLVEQVSGRRVMSSLHAGYSLGALAGAVAGGLFARAGVGPLGTFLAAGLPGAALAVLAGRWLEAGSRERAVLEPDAAAAGLAAGSTAPRAGRGRLTRPGALILMLGVTGLCALLAEGAAADWSAVYLRDNLGTSAGLAAAGFAAFSVTMAAGRLAGDRLAAAFGPVRLVRTGGVVAAAGLAGGLISGQPGWAIAGFAVFGAGLSGMAPQIFLAGGQADPARPGHGLARVVGVSYLGMVGGPALIGGAASLVGLPLALGIPVVLALGVAALAGVVGRPAPLDDPQRLHVLDR
ncbi:MAG TPA: MFS transporter [Streptosporangiaceae bacterium]|nr:MFS transporter [Streptosporangiaceae bacterium]